MDYFLIQKKTHILFFTQYIINMVLAVLSHCDIKSGQLS